jgi:serine/threonine protein phosphatase PrpC
LNSESGVLNSLRLTTDHIPDVEEERARIEAVGGLVYPADMDGRLQIWTPSGVPVLGITRSVCSWAGKAVGITSEPEFFTYNFHQDGKRDLALVLGSDGLWTFVSDEEVMKVAIRSEDPAQAVNALLKTSQDRWIKNVDSIDDITICVVYLTPPS